MRYVDIVCVFCCFKYRVFFFKQKTAYGMRISDWSSDVCSSDLGAGEPHALLRDPPGGRHAGRGPEPAQEGPAAHVRATGEPVEAQIVPQVLADPVEQRPDRASPRSRDRRLDVLGLAALALRRDDHASSDLVVRLPSPTTPAHHTQKNQ